MLLALAKSEDSDQPVHPRSLTGAFSFCVSEEYVSRKTDMVARPATE